MKKLIKTGLICLMTTFLVGFCGPISATDPPMPPDNHNEETDKDMGGGAPLGDDLYFYLGIAGLYLTIQSSRLVKEQSSG